MNRNYLFTYIIFFFILGFFLLLYFLFQNTSPHFDFSNEQDKISVYSFSQKLNNANNFYKRQQYEMTIKVLDEISLGSSSVGGSLNDKQKHSVAMLKACSYKSMGLYNTSLKLIKEALNHYETPFAYYLKGLVYEKQQRMNEAVEIYLNCLKLDPFYYYAYERLGDMYFQKADYQQSVEYYNCKGVIKTYLPEILHLKKAFSLYLLGDSQTSLDLINEYLGSSKMKRYLSFAHFLKAIVGEFSLAESAVKEHFLTAIETSRKEQIALIEYYYALYLIKKGSYQKAVQILTTHLELYEKNNENIYFTLGQIFYLQKQYKRSWKYFSLNAALNNNNNNNKNNKERRDIYYLAITSYKLKKYQTAIKYFDQLLKNRIRDEYSLSAYICLAYSYVKLGQFQDSIRLLNVGFEEFGINEPLVFSLAEIVLEQSPRQFNRLLSKHVKSGEYPKLNLLLASYHLKNNRRNFALELMMEYIQKEKPTAKILKVCGDINLHQRNMQKAQNHYQHALRLVNDEEQKVEILNNLAYCYFSKGDLQKAKAVLNSALAVKLDPSINLNLYLLNQDDISVAKAFLFAAENEIKQAKENELRASIYFEMGLWHINENLGKARNYFEKAVGFNPKHQLAQYYLNEI